MTLTQARRAMRLGTRVVGCATASTGGPKCIRGETRIDGRRGVMVETEPGILTPFLPGELTEYFGEVHAPSANARAKDAGGIVDHHAESGPEERLQDAWRAFEDDAEFPWPVRDWMSPSVHGGRIPPAWPEPRWWSTA